MSDPTPQTQPPTTPPPAADPQTEPGPIPYARFKEVNEGYQTVKAQLAKLEEAQKKATEAKLVEEGKTKELLTAREQELATEKAARLRDRIALKKGLSGDLADLADRLKGSTEEELEADADRLLALIKPKGDSTPPPPGVPPGGGGKPGQRINVANMSPKEIREARAKGQI